MKICIVQGAFLPVPPIMGGAVEKIWYRLGQEFVRQGHRVVHISRAHPELPQLQCVGGVEHRRVKGHMAPRWMGQRLWLDWLYSRRALAALPASDIVVTNSFWLPVLLDQKIKSGRIYVHVARFPKGQLRLYRGADRLQTVSNAVAEAMKQQVPELAAKIAVVPNPLPELDFTLPTRSVLEANKFLFVGRLHPEKGIEWLIRAALELKEEYQLRIVGPWQLELGGGGEPYGRFLQSLAAKSNGRIQLIGPVFEEEKLRAEMDQAGVFIYPSQADHGETFGLAPLEAMSRGCVPLVSDLNCFRDFIQPGVNGFVFERSGGIDGLRRRLSEMMNLPNLLEFSRRAQETARDFHVSRIAQLYLEDFQRVLGPCN